MRTVDWDSENNQLQLIDQRLLPDTLKINTYSDYESVASAIRNMVVRGAPAIGATAAYGMALAAINSKANTRATLVEDLNQAANVLKNTRPTAVNLSWGVDQILRITLTTEGSPDQLCEAILSEAQRIADQDVLINQTMARIGADLINDGDIILHHCNTGALATVDWGTALGVIRMAHTHGKRIHVLVDETRPRFQGARLTAWELSQYGIPYDIITDNAAGYFLKSGIVQKVFFGADRVAANGDIANKIGTYMLALAAYDNHVPAYCVAPTSTIDLSLNSGDSIPIEERQQDEVLNVQFEQRVIHPTGASARNPAFDITPNRLVTAIVTEKGVVYPPYVEKLQSILSS